MKKSYLFYLNLAIISFAFSVYEWFRWSMAIEDLDSARCHEGLWDICGAALGIHQWLFFLSSLLGVVMIAISITMNRRKVSHNSSKSIPKL